MNHGQDNNKANKKTFKQINHIQRHTIQTLYRNKMKIIEIAKLFNVHRSSIYRELQRGKVVNKRSDLSEFVTYSADRAIFQSKENASNKGPSLKIGTHKLLNQNLKKLMTKGKASPYAALVTCKEHFTSEYDIEHMPCVKTIYNYIHKYGLPILPEQMICKKRKAKAKNPRKRPGHHTRVNMGIETRDPEIEKREELGHHEMDLVVGAQGTKDCLLVLTERMTRYEHIIKLNDKTQESIRKGLNILEIHYGKSFKELFKTITCDNGSEFLDPELITKSRWGKANRCKLYYAHPYCSSERGSNENANKLIRRFIPKGVSMENVTQQEVNNIAYWMNHYPRKLFSGKSSCALTKQFTFHSTTT